MALVLADRVKETTTTTGTGTVTLLGASTGFQSFAVIGNANTTYYTITAQTGTEWEVGIGTYTSAGTLLARTTVLSSSNSGNLVDFTAGTKDVFVTYPSSRSVYADGAILTATNSSVLPITSGGTSLATLTANNVILGNGTSAPLFVAPSTTGNILTSNGSTWTSAAPAASGVTSFTAGTTGFTPNTATTGAVTLAGTLATTNGGTNLTSFTSGGVVYASSSSALATGSALTFAGGVFGINSASAYLNVTTTSGASYFGDAASLISGVGASDSAIRFDGSNLLFSHSNLEKMRLTSAGNLGIGTSSPATKLHVNNTTGAVQVRASGDSDVSFSAVATAADSTAFLTVINDARQWTLRVNGAESDQFQLRDSTAGATRLVVNSSGDVGIGTTSPSYKLHVRGADATAVLVVGNTSEGTQLEVLTYQDDRAVLRANDTSNVARSLAFETGTSEKFRIGTAGQFGIGGANYGNSGQVLTSGGASAAPSWTTIASGLSAASQAEMEAASSNTVAATPLNTKWHPGVAKVWLRATNTGSAISASYNVTSITDNGPGSITVTIDTDFSSASYVITTFGAGANSNQAQLNYVTSQSAGSFSADCINPNFTNVDPQTAWYFACFGDQ